MFLPALTPLPIPKPPPAGTERPWQLRLLVTNYLPPIRGGGGPKKKTPVEFRFAFVAFWVEKFFGVGGHHL